MFEALSSSDSKIKASLIGYKSPFGVTRIEEVMQDAISKITIDEFNEGAVMVRITC